MRKINVFHIGPQKSATTWVYRCLDEHPGMACPQTDAIHYFDLFYQKGEEWLFNNFGAVRDEQKLIDPTPSYIRSSWAPRRIYQHNPGAKIMLCMRHPIERAFSHYLHEKKKGKYNFEFSEVLHNYDLFSSWIEPGFYAEHIERYLQYFPREQVLCLLFDDLKKDPEAFLKQILDFIGVDSSFKPKSLNAKTNVAGIKGKYWRRFIEKSGVPNILPSKIKREGLKFLRKEYEKGIPPEIRKELYEICFPEIERLEKLLDMDLSMWKK